MALRHTPLLLAFAAPILLWGCVSTKDVTDLPAPPPRVLRITYISDPLGALVVDSAGKAWGRAPVTLAYPGAVAMFAQAQCVHPWPITMRWPSGAQQTIKPEACSGNGLDLQRLVERPKDAPGIDLDVQFAAAEEQARAAREAATAQAQAARDVAAAEAQAEHDAAATEALAIINAATPGPATPAPFQSLHCTSRTVGQGQYARTTTDCN